MIIKFKPSLSDKIWGGSNLKKLYNYDASDSCGEAWGISAHPSGPSIVDGGTYNGRTLAELFTNNRELFGNYEGDSFPILVKVIDASDNLSIQVHPDDSYAKKFNSFGKEECWYILDCEDDAEIIIGHSLTSKEQFEQAIKEGTLENYCNSFPIKKGDFFYIEAGTLHAICKGTMILEVQQSSDITYRVYDYNRLQNGVPRPLHIEESIDVTTIPANPLVTEHRDKYFTYEIFDNNEDTTFQSHIHGDYIFIIDGEGYIGDTSVKAGDFIMVTSDSTYQVKGTLKVQKSKF